MDIAKRIERLKELEVLQGLAEEKLAELARLLEPVVVGSGNVVVEEGDRGDCLYLVGDGRLRVDKRITSGEGAERVKELAVMGRGDFFGEMALLEEETRSARVTAISDCLLFKIGRTDFFQWLQSQPALTVAFFLTLLRGVSRRLRVTSRELTLLYDLAGLLLDQNESEAEVVTKVLLDMARHLEGDWTIASYLYNEYNGEYTLAAVEGVAPQTIRVLTPPGPRQALGWAGERVLWTALPGREVPLGYFLLLAAAPVDARGREETDRIASTVARLLVSGILNLRHSQEEVLRARLKSVPISS